MFRETPHVPTFGSVLSGHALTAVPMCVLLVLGLWVARLTPALAEAGLIDLLAVGIASTVLMTVVQVGIFRVVSWVKQHYQPGSPVLAIDHVITPVVSTGLVTYVSLVSPTGALMAGLTALLTVVPVLLYMNQPWKSGITREELFQKLDEHRQMTREVARGDHDSEWLKRLQDRQ